MEAIGYRRELELVAEILRSDPLAKIVYDGIWTDPATGMSYKADVLDVNGKNAIQVKTLSGTGLVGAIGDAVKQFDGVRSPGRDGVREEAPPGWGRTVVVFVEPLSKRYFLRSKEELEATLRRQLPLGAILCDPSGSPRMNELVVVNARGVHRWLPDQFRLLTGKEC